MPAYTLTQDILAICLILTKGKSDLTLEKMLTEIDVFQENHDRHFGISRHDIRGLLYTLIKYDLGFEKELDQVLFIEIIPEILKYQNSYFNDEGEFFELREDEHVRYSVLRSLLWNQVFHNYSMEELKEKIRIKQRLVKFFLKQGPHTPKSVMNLLKSIQYDEEVLFHCSRPGEWS